MFGVGFFELVIIAVIALVVVGPKRLPEVMRQAGRIFVHLRRTANDVRATFDDVIRQAEEDMRREQAQSLRDALKPVQDAHHEVRALLSGNVPQGPDGVMPFKPGVTDHPLDTAANALPPAEGESSHLGGDHPQIAPPIVNPMKPVTQQPVSHAHAGDRPLASEPALAPDAKKETT